MKTTTSKATETTTAPQFTADEIDTYLAAQYEARDSEGGFVARLFAMADEADEMGKGGRAAILAGIRELAVWEMGQR